MADSCDDRWSKELTMSTVLWRIVTIDQPRFISQAVRDWLTIEKDVIPACAGVPLVLSDVNQESTWIVVKWCTHKSFDSGLEFAEKEIDRRNYIGQGCLVLDVAINEDLLGHGLVVGIGVTK